MIPPRPLTKTEAQARDQRLKFQRSIAARAAKLEAKDRAAPVDIASAMAAPGSPRMDGLLAELLALRNQLVEKLDQLNAVVVDMTPARPTIRVFQKAVAKYYAVGLNDLCSARRTAAVVRPRQVAYYLSKELTEFSLPVIGRQFGGRDHTTMLYGVRKIEGLLPRDARLAHDVATLFELITGTAQ